MDVTPATTVTDGAEVAWRRRQRWTPSETSTTVDGRLTRLKSLHEQTISNWTGSLDDAAAFDYLDVPLVKVSIFHL